LKSTLAGQGDMVVMAKNGRRRAAASTRSLKTVVDFAVGSHARAVTVLLVVALLSFLPGFFSIPPIDRDEARFAQATKQMLESGDYVDIRFQDEVRYKKPVGIYWLQAAVVRTASALGFERALTTIWLYRMPSLVGAIGAVLLLLGCARLGLAARRSARGADDGELPAARYRAAHRQDRCHAAHDRRRCHGRLGAHLPPG